MPVTISLPVKPYVKYYLHRKFGTPMQLQRRGNIGRLLYRILEDPIEEKEDLWTFQYCTEKIDIILSDDLFFRRGHHLTNTNIKDFNKEVEDEINQIAFTTIETYLDVKKSKNIKKAIDYFLDKYTFSPTELPYDTLKQNYYRWRKGIKKQM